MILNSKRYFCGQMPRILAIDYGAKRCGLAETDDLQIIASRLGMVENAKLMDFVLDYVAKHKSPCVVIGEPFRASGEHSDIWKDISTFAQALSEKLPALEIAFVDEQFSSMRAMESMLQAGLKKSKRREKGMLDAQSATLILQDYLNNRSRSL